MCTLTRHIKRFSNDNTNLYGIGNAKRNTEASPEKDWENSNLSSNFCHELSSGNHVPKTVVLIEDKCWNDCCARFQCELYEPLPTLKEEDEVIFIIAINEYNFLYTSRT